MTNHDEQDFPTQELPVPASGSDSAPEPETGAPVVSEPDATEPAAEQPPADTPPAEPTDTKLKPTLNMADVLAKLKTPPAGPAAPTPVDKPTATDGQPAQTDDIGSPEADVLAQAAEVLNGAAHTVQTEHLLAERTNDLQRVQAEYANYRKRVERDRALSRTQGAEGVIRELMPVFDGIAHAQEHEELTGGFKVVAGELARVMTGLGLVTFGAVGDEFDPTLHEALMQVPSTDVPAGRIAQVIQLGYKLGETVLRPARVAVAAEPG